MSRPAGEPGALAAAARGLAAAGEALRGTGAGLRGISSFVVVAGAWRGPASEAFLLDGAGSQARLAGAAEALAEAAAALAELAARLASAQATWDRARRLAATVGFDLDPMGGGPVPTAGISPGRQEGAVASGAGAGSQPGMTWSGVGGGTYPPGRTVAPTGAVDFAVAAVLAQVERLAEAAGQEAAAARRVAAARFDQAAAVARRPGPPSAGHGGPGRHDPGAGDQGRSGHGGHGPGAGGGHGGAVGRAVGRVLEAGAEVAAATHHLVDAAEARLQAAARLAVTADDPAVRTAAGRVVDTAGEQLLDGRAHGALPLVAPVLDFAAAVHHGEPLPRAAAGAIGGAVGADLGARAGLALCGGQAAATQGAGLVVCPALTVVGGALGGRAGKAAALDLYDAVAGPPAPPPAKGPR